MIDLVVVNYRTPFDLERCILSLGDNPPSSSEATLTIVNVCPTDEDRLIANRSFNTEVISVDDNIGYARACNLGAKHGVNPYVGLFNADVEFTPGVVDECVAELNGRTGIVGPRQTNRAGQLTAAGIIGTRERPKHRFWMQDDKGQANDTLVCPTVSGSAFFVRRDVWTELTECEAFQNAVAAEIGMAYPEGAFLTTKHFYEETFCCYHAAEHGYDSMYLGSSHMIHDLHGAGSPDPGVTGESRAQFRAVCDRLSIPHD